MTRINAGNTLANQYAPPFVITNNITTNWQLRWNADLIAFEAFDPSENVPAAGFESIQQALFSNTTNQQVFVVPWGIDPDLTMLEQKATLYITINGVKQHTGEYTLSVGTNSTTITLNGTTGTNDDVEIIGLQATGGAAVKLFNATGDGSTQAWAIGWLAPSEQSLLITVDGVKQQTSAYSISSLNNFTDTTISFTSPPSASVLTATPAAVGTGYVVGDLLTLAGGTPSATGTEAIFRVDAIAGGAVTSVSVVSGGSYTVLPASPGAAVTGGSGGDDETFTLVGSGQAIEVVGITTTGEVPASPVDAANLSGGVGAVGSGDPGTARLYSGKSVAGENQVLNFRGLVAGTGIEFAETANSVRIDSTGTASFSNIGAGAEVIAPVPGTTDPLTFHSLTGGSRIDLSLASDILTWAVDPGYVVAGATPHNAVVGENLIVISSLPAIYTVVLPLISTLTVGDPITIKNQTAGVFAITIQPHATDAGALIDGAGTTTITSAYGYTTLYTNGTHFYIIATSE